LAQDGDRLVTSDELRSDLVILACAISAGIHGALVPEHFAEGLGPGTGFVVATVALAALAVALTLRLGRPLTLAAAAAVFAGLLASYALAITTGLPVLHPDSEPVDGLALATKAIEVAGLVAAWSLIRRPSLAFAIPQPKGTST
jgi:CHASE2 domain-containing sensor protein